MRVIIGRTDAIGDLLLTLPLAKLIKEHHPHAKVGVLVGPRCRHLMPLIDGLDAHWVFDPRQNAFSKWRHLAHVFAHFAPDTYLYAGGSHWPSFYAWFARLPTRAGLLSRWPSFLFLNRGVRQSRGDGELHEGQCNLDLLAPLGIRPRFAAQHYRTVFHLNDGEKRTVEQRFRRGQGNDTRPLIFIHPGMGGSALNWPSSHYGRLIERLAQLYPGRYLYTISHTDSDAPYLVELRHYLKKTSLRPERDFYFYNGGQAGLRHFVHLLSHAQLLIAPSTGPTHLANSLGVKQVALYSPLAGQKRWTPLRRDGQVAVLTPGVECPEHTHCAGENCPFHPCMPKLEVERVAKVCRQFLESAAGENP